MLLSDDKCAVEAASDVGLTAFTFRQYVESLSGRPELIDRMAAKHDDLTDPATSSNKSKHIVYPEHLRMKDIQAGLKAGRLYQGAFQASGTHLCFFLFQIKIL